MEPSTDYAGRLDDPAARRWLHDKYERLAADEDELAGSRTSYFAAIGTVLITGMLVSLDYFAAVPHTLVLVATFLSGLGIMISFTWSVLLHRTLDARSMWREAAVQIEQLKPPIEGELAGTVTLRSGDTIPIDLLRPYTAHARRFSGGKSISWMDRLPPGSLMEVLPVCFLGIWSAVLVGVWVFVWF